MCPTWVDECGWEGLPWVIALRSPRWVYPLGGIPRSVDPARRQGASVCILPAGAGPLRCPLRLHGWARLCVLRGAKGWCPPSGLRSLRSRSKQGRSGGRLFLRFLFTCGRRPSAKEGPYSRFLWVLGFNTGGLSPLSGPSFCAAVAISHAPSAAWGLSS